MIATINLAWIIPLSVILGMIAMSLFCMSGIQSDAEARQDESHSATRYAQDDYIDWRKVSDGYDWIAMDADGTICQFAGAAPVCGASMEGGRDMWYVHKDGKVWRENDILPTSAIIGPLPPWRESLRRRPK